MGNELAERQKLPVPLYPSLFTLQITAGTAANVGGDSIMFHQQGILARSRIIPLLAECLRAAGKLVEVNWV